MSKTVEVSLEQRQATYDDAEARAMKVAEQYVEARADGEVPFFLSEEMDDAQADLLRAKRHLEKTQRRLAKQGA